MVQKIPKPIIEIIQKLEAAGFEAFVVGGCVRDLMMGVGPKDWDVTTNAKPLLLSIPARANGASGKSCGTHASESSGSRRGPMRAHLRPSASHSPCHRPLMKPTTETATAAVPGQGILFLAK